MMMTTATAMTTLDTDNDEASWFAPRRPTIPELLAMRQQWGLDAPRRRAARVTPEALSKAVAWNPTRLQNAIMAIGPGTPATMFGDSSGSSSSEDDQDSDSTDENNEHNEDDDDEDNNEGDEGTGFLPSLEQVREDPRWRHVGGSQLPSGQQAVVFQWVQGMGAGVQDVNMEPASVSPAGKFVSSMRHNGCINVATWLTSSWRLSLCGDDAASSTSVHVVDSQECPTQLITSGDDRVVKFWDVRHAMGMTNPLPGGRYVAPPFADLAHPTPCNWKLQAKRGLPLPGNVIPLATLETGHRNNIFHVTPLDHQPGKVVTCGADGYLRISDLSSSSPSSSTIVISPEYDNEDSLGISSGLIHMRPGMCFSHHFLNANTGLLCSERGLKRFDLRLSPREQSSRSLLGPANSTCKSCAIWSISSSSLDHIDSAYVFAGGSSGEVTLFDLRMTDENSTKVVQRYQPRGIGRNASVSVSGIDISRDKKELLVSYENDQIFTFPIFPQATSAAGPSLEELTKRSHEVEKDKKGTTTLTELASYGGHLNRFTFLKNAKYAGPNDEYICTGSDSGHAWIYERATGAVSSFLCTDTSTCNGVIPHPTLPLFVTYGIDATAKLWRATTPVDPEADDSPLGRARRYHGQEYTKSPVIHNWAHVKVTAAELFPSRNSGNDSVLLLPDQIPLNDSLQEIHRMGAMFFRNRTGPVGDFVLGNNLRNLPKILQQNYFACARAYQAEEDKPVLSGLGHFARRTSTIRLRHQADQRGLLWNSKMPWILHPREYYLGKELADIGADNGKRLKNSDSTKYGNAIDLVPDNPSDWIPYDPDMCRKPRPCGTIFDVEHYADFYYERYENDSSLNDGKMVGKTPWFPTSTQKTTSGKEETVVCTNGEGGAEGFDHDRALFLLHETALLLKDGGNEALAAGSVKEAARRYDRAIRYCAVALLDPWKNAGRERSSSSSSSTTTTASNATSVDFEWSPIRKLLIVIRLNLSKVLAGFDWKGAIEQAMLAIMELKPFCKGEGKVATFPLGELVRNNEPVETFREAKELQAKAFFRCGTVEFKTGDYSEAVKSFESSVQSMKAISQEPEPILLRRLAEAKRERAKRKKRQRKGFKKLFEDDEASGENADEST